MEPYGTLVCLLDPVLHGGTYVHVTFETKLKVTSSKLIRIIQQNTPLQDLTQCGGYKAI